MLFYQGLSEYNFCFLYNNNELLLIYTSNDALFMQIKQNKVYRKRQRLTRGKQPGMKALILGLII